MRLLFIADGRSPIALNWISYFAQSDHEVHLVSTFICKPNLHLASLSFVSVAFSGKALPSSTSPTQRAISGAGKIGLRTALRHWLGPFTVLSAARKVRSKIEALEPDLVHAMRIPFEGMLGTAIDPPAPLLVSVWGNDFTLHAPASPWMGNLTRRTLGRVDALHLDCNRDLRLAREWGYPQDQSTIVLPGAGGIRTNIFHPAGEGDPQQGNTITSLLEDLPKDSSVVVNPRGFRAYVRNDTFFQSIPTILAEKPKTQFLCPAMADEKRAHDWIDKLNIRQAVKLLPKLSSQEMAAIFQRADVAVSPSEHDGTPNTLLEAMACGSFPIAGDLESIREWIEPGMNGYLIDPGHPKALAQMVLRVLDDPNLRDRAQAENVSIINKRAKFETVMSEAESFYVQMIR